MKKILSVLILSLASQFLCAQANVNADCINAIPLCNNPNFKFYQTSGPGSVIDFSVGSTISNPTNDPFLPSWGCLKQGELKPQWLLLTVGNPGLLEFVFGAANSANPQAGCYDWIMWQYNVNTCSGIFNNTLPPIRCCWNNSCSNGTGLASKAHVLALGGDTLDFGAPLQVQACQQFIICISNYSGVDTDVSFQTLGTASLSCSPNCSPNYSICAGQSATIVPVNFAGLTNASYSLQPGNVTNTTGSFVVTPPSTTTYTTYITGTNISNQVETIHAVSIVTIMPTPAVAITVTQTTCTDTLTKVNVQLTWSPNPPSTYSLTWLPTIPNGVLTPTTTTASAVMAPGVYTVVAQGPGGCTASQTFVVNPPPAQATINLSPNAPTHTITCYTPTIPITALVGSQSYTWTNGLVAQIVGSVAVMDIGSIGNWTVAAQNTVSGCFTKATYAVTHNTVAPTSVLSPTFQNITCTVSSIQIVTATANPTANITQYVMSPLGGTLSTQSPTMLIEPGGVGNYTHCLVNDVNGCSTCKTFTVYSNQGFPTFSLVSAENFSLGCTTRSVANVQIINASATNSNQVPNGGPVTYTLLAPGASPILPPGLLSTTSNYTINSPGTWTIVTRDNISSCETRVPFSILLNTIGPKLTVTYPHNIIDCKTPSVTLEGSSTTPNVSFNWIFPGTPPSLQNPNIVVNANFSAPNTSLVANYTLEVKDMSSTCVSTSVIPIYQSLYAPTAAFSGTGALSCIIKNITLTNQSKSNIPKGSIFPTSQPAVGYLWTGPTPQQPKSNATTYLAQTPGVYTLVSMDMNNGCIGSFTSTILDNIKYPAVNYPDKPDPAVLDCGAKQATLMPIITAYGAGATYTWTDNGESITSDKNKIPLLTDRTGDYRLAVRNPSSGCITNVIMTVVNGELTADFIPDKTTGFAPLAVNFENRSLSTTGQSSITSIWSFDNGKTHTVSSVAAANTVFNAPGTYSVTLFVTKGQCQKSVTKVIQVDIPSEVEIPNIFTPNGDGINDEFFVKGTNLTSIEFLVTDRWGHEVYRLTSGSGNVLWDGKNQTGKKVSEGVYFYTLKANGSDGVNYDKTGTITVSR